MHRIDGPTAAPGGLWTEGDPLGGVPATIVSGAFMNDTQENLIALLTAAGITPIKGDYSQVLAAIRGLSSGVVGTNRRLRCVVTAASASAQFTADELVLKTSTGRARIITNFNKTINTGGTGIAGMLSGLAPVSGYVAFYAGCKEDGTSGLFGIDATSINAPEIAAAAPTDYIYTALVGVAATDASRLIKPIEIYGRDHWISPIQIYNSTVQQATLTLLASNFMSLAVPLNAVNADFSTVIASSSANVTMTSSIAGNVGASGGVGQKLNSTTSGSAGAGNQAQHPNIPLPVAQQAAYSCVVAAGTMTYGISISRYSI